MQIFMFFSWSFFIIFVVFFLMFLWSFWVFRNDFSNDREKASSFECGFDPKKKSRLSFSFRFFYLLLIFLIFDVEISLMLKFPLVIHSFFYKEVFVLLILLFVLYLGLLEEFRRGMFSWKV